MPPITGRMLKRAKGASPPAGLSRSALYQLKALAKRQPGRGLMRTSGPNDHPVPTSLSVVLLRVTDPPTPMRPLVWAEALSALLRTAAVTRAILIDRVGNIGRLC